MRNLPLYPRDFSRDAASLRSLAPDADGLTNEATRLSAERGRDFYSLVCIQLSSERRANKFDRGFPSVDELDGSAF